MREGERYSFAKGILQIKESLDVAVTEAGGAAITVEELEHMTALKLLDILSTNSIRFYFRKEK